MFSDGPEDYSIGSPIGFGASSIVYSAVYNSPSPQRPIPCALKVLDLDTLHPRSLSLLQRETQLMSLSKHPNVLRVRGSWMDGCKLYIALRLMNKGSAADVMHYSWPGGMEEEVVKCILKQALEGLNYLHINGFIHRDIKAANLLIDEDGTVLVGDLGVAASLADDPDASTALSDGRRTRPDVSLAQSRVGHPVRPHMGKRKSFVGTPCWMAPELIEGKQYDAKADIWSFGITAIELTQGRPPRSRESPQTVLLQTVQGRPPTLDREGGVHRYSKAFKDIVDACLRKDPSKRPTAAQLLQTPFFKSAKKKSYLVGAILSGLPPLAMRQEQHRRPPSLMAQLTADSWDFSLPTIRPRTNDARDVHTPRDFSSTTTRHSFEKVDLSPQATYPCFDSASSENRMDEDLFDGVCIVIDSGTKLSPHLENVDLEDEEKQNLDGRMFPPLSSSPSVSSESSESLQAHEPLPQCTTNRISTPIPICAPQPPVPKSSGSSCSPPGTPSSMPLITAPSVWDRVTRRASRRGSDGSPTESKASRIARFLKRRPSLSHTQHSNLLEPV